MCFKVADSDILLFDMDETLIFTNQANKYAYQEALSKQITEYIKSKFSDIKERLEHGNIAYILQSILDDLNVNLELMANSIIQYKRDNYLKYLNLTQINQTIYNVLRKYYKSNQVFLLTDARRERVESLLKYHHIKEFGDNIYCNESGNKFANIITQFDFNVHNLIVFEDNTKSIDLALEAGIDRSRIFYTKENKSVV